jgi:hypothetical protein
MAKNHIVSHPIVGRTVPAGTSVTLEIDCECKERLNVLLKYSWEDTDSTTVGIKVEIQEGVDDLQGSVLYDDSKVDSSSDFPQPATGLIVTFSTQRVISLSTSTSPRWRKLTITNLDLSNGMTLDLYMDHGAGSN